jgi:alpha-amylase
MDTNSDIYKMTAAINKARKAMQSWNYDLQEKYVLDNVYAFSRGQMMVATTNRGDTVNFSPQACWDEGTTVCNIFYPTTDCQQVQNGKITIYLVNGESKIYIPQNSAFFDEETSDMAFIQK